MSHNFGPSAALSNHIDNEVLRMEDSARLTSVPHGRVDKPFIHVKLHHKDRVSVIHPQHHCLQRVVE